MRCRADIRDEKGQASVEYLLVGLVLLALMGAFAALWHATSSGGMTGLLEHGVSHAVDSIGGLCDALLF